MERSRGGPRGQALSRVGGIRVRRGRFRFVSAGSLSPSLNCKASESFRAARRFGIRRLRTSYDVGMGVRPKTLASSDHPRLSRQGTCAESGIESESLDGLVDLL